MAEGQMATHTRTLQMLFLFFFTHMLNHERRQASRGRKKTDGFANPTFDFDSEIKCSFRHPYMSVNYTHGAHVCQSSQHLFALRSYNYENIYIYVYLYIVSSTELTVNIFDCNYFQLKKKSL